MRIRKNKIRNYSPYYIWQTKTYGKDYYLSDEETHIYLFRPMPCTPAGNLIARFDNLNDALEKLKELSK